MGDTTVPLEAHVADTEIGNYDVIKKTNHYKFMAGAISFRIKNRIKTSVLEGAFEMLLVGNDFLCEQILLPAN